MNLLKLWKRLTTRELTEKRLLALWGHNPILKLEVSLPSGRMFRRRTLDYREYYSKCRYQEVTGSTRWDDSCFTHPGQPDWSLIQSMFKYDRAYNRQITKVSTYQGVVLYEKP